MPNTSSLGRRPSVPNADFSLACSFHHLLHPLFLPGRSRRAAFSGLLDEAVKYPNSPLCHEKDQACDPVVCELAAYLPQSCSQRLAQRRHANRPSDLQRLQDEHAEHHHRVDRLATSFALLCPRALAPRPRWSRESSPTAQANRSPQAGRPSLTAPPADCSHQRNTTDPPKPSTAKSRALLESDLTADGQIIIIRASLRRVSCKLSTPYLTRAYEIWVADGPADDADDAVILANTNLPGDLGFAFSGALCAAGNMPPAQKAWSARLLQKEGRSVIWK